MNKSFNESLSCGIPTHLEFGFFLFQLSPIFAFPVYLLAIYLLIFKSNIHAKRIRKIYLRNLVFNVMCMITISIILCPIFYLPMIGYQSNGLIQYLPLNLAVPAIFTVYCLIGVAISIMHLFHHRLNAIASMTASYTHLLVLKILQKLVYLNYIFLVLTCFSFMGLLTVQSLQPTIKPIIYEKYHIPEVWCSKFLVSDPFSWQIMVAFVTTVFLITGVGIVVISCGILTFVILMSERKNLSSHTLGIQKKFTLSLIMQAIVHIVFIIGPIICVIVSAYMNIWINDGGLVIFLIESQQGTASTIVFILTHSATKRYVGYYVRKATCRQTKMDKRMWITSKYDMKTRSII